MLDRTVDLVSPFCVQKTYQGLVDDNFGIKTNMTSVQTKIINSKWEELGLPENTEMCLDTEDFLFTEIKEMNFDCMRGIVEQRQSDINELMAAGQKDKQESKDQDKIKELSGFLKKVKDMNLAKLKTSLDAHINMSHYFKANLDEFDTSQLFQIEQSIIAGSDVQIVLKDLAPKMVRNCNILQVMRLMTLLSVCNNGLKQTDLDQMRQIFIASYGYQEIPTLMNLQDARLLRLGDDVLDKVGQKVFAKDRMFNWNKIVEVSLHPAN